MTMPNHIYNEVTLRGVTLDQVAAIVSDRENAVTFKKLLPLPLNFWLGSVGSKEEEAFPGNGLDAATETWGTKWDCYGDPKIAEGDEANEIILTFDTAWSPPRGWVVALFNSFDCNCKLRHLWTDEGDDSTWLETYTPASETGNPIFGPRWEKVELPFDSREHERIYLAAYGRLPGDES